MIRAADLTEDQATKNSPARTALFSKPSTRNEELVAAARAQIEEISANR
ncbi:hypothetical protein [Rhodococcus tukisamuensis]|nr:hypothetical protein [Rhodococcus tukisamuensis]